MKVLIEQLRAEHFQIKRLLFSVAAAVHAGKPTELKEASHKLGVVLLGHVGFERTVLPELARLDRVRGHEERAEKVFLFARELEFIEHALRNVLTPLEVRPGNTTTLRDWTNARDVIDALLAEEFALLELHATGNAERRQMPRVSCECPAVLKGSGDGVAQVRDLSLSGMRMELEHPLAVGTFIDVRLLLPGTPAPVDVMAEVRWLAGRGGEGKRGVGARFVDLQPNAGLAIASWVATAAVRRGRLTARS